MKPRRDAGRGPGPVLPQPLRATAVRTVRFQEVDLMGVVWHGRFMEYFEDGRSALGKACGLDYEDFFREGIKAPIVHIEVEYKHPLLLGDAVRIETSLLWTEAVRLNHEYVLKRDADGKEVARGRSVQLLLDASNNLLFVWPEYFVRLRNDWRRGVLRNAHE